MPEFILQTGTHRRADGTRAEPGDRVHLTDRQTEQFNMDRFDPVEAAEATDESGGSDEPAERVGDEPERLDEPPEASTDIPDDWDLLRSMAIVVADEYDEPINGQSARDEINGVLEEYEPEERAQIRQRAESRLED